MHLITTRPTLTERLRDAARSAQPTDLPGHTLQQRLPLTRPPRLHRRAPRLTLEGFRP